MKKIVFPLTPRLSRRSNRHARYWLGALLATMTCLTPLPSLAQPTHATGTVEVGWRGKGGPNLEPGETKYAFTSFAAFPATSFLESRGEFIYTVLNPDLTVHREIVVELFNVSTGFDTEGYRRAWMAGVVVSDTKLCSGGAGGHSGGEDGEGGCDEGCSHDTGDTTHDDGCAGGGSDSGMGGGPPEGEGSDSGSEGGCSHDTGDTNHDDGCAGGGESGGGGGVNGKDSRVGQILVAKVKDNGSPGAIYDHITWKWFAVPAEEEWSGWMTVDLPTSPIHLCKKTILSGNLAVHGL